MMLTPAENDRRQLTLEFIVERLGFVRAHAEVGQIEADVGDVTAVGYALQRARMQLTAAIDAYNQAAATKRGMPERG